MNRNKWPLCSGMTGRNHRNKQPSNLSEETMKIDPLTAQKCKELKISVFLGLKLAHVLAKIIKNDILIETRILPDQMEGGDKPLSEILKEKYWKNPCTKELNGFGKIFVKE